MLYSFPGPQNSLLCFIYKNRSDYSRIVTKPIHVCIFFQISGTIEDPTIYKDIKNILQKHGYARIVADPQ